MRKAYFSAVALVGVLVGSAPALATNFSFTGTFATDATVQTFNFTVGSTSTVTFETLSYAGGTNSAGTVISRGGFDPILALFDGTGALINQNDDGTNVPTDPVTGVRYDTFLQASLAAGSYTVSVMEYDNFANGPNLSDGFSRQGAGNFTSAFTCSAAQTSFRDVSATAGCGRTNAWAFDILNVGSATQNGGGDNGGTGGTTMPEPASMALLGAGLAAMGLVRRKRG